MIQEDYIDVLDYIYPVSSGNVSTECKCLCCVFYAQLTIYICLTQRPLLQQVVFSWL